MRLFSDRDRPVHLGPFPLERWARGPMPDLARAAPMRPLVMARAETPASILNAMEEYQAMMDAIRDGIVAERRSDIPGDPAERSRHLKAFAHFQDAAMAGTGPLPDAALLDRPIRNPGIDRLAEALRTRQTKTLASGIDVIMADLKESMEAGPTGIEGHAHAIVVAAEEPRPPAPDEPGAEWLTGAGPAVAALRAAETASILANYLRILGWEAKAHSATASDVDLPRLAVACGLGMIEPDGAVVLPYLGARHGLAAVTTTLALDPDAPLAPRRDQPRLRTHGARWWLGWGTRRGGLARGPYARRAYHRGPPGTERLRRIETPTTYIDEPRVARVPKRTDMFARAQFGDMGRKLQDAAKGGFYARKAATAAAQRRLLGALVLLQDGPPETEPVPGDARDFARAVKAASHFLGIDATGLSRCPDWAWYSHDATGAPIDPPHDQAISMIVDQGFETMEGASGDDWISVAQSMRAYLRFSLLGGILAKQIRRLGYRAKAHTVLDGEVLQPPLLLLSGLGEVSRIGEVILHPSLGPRLKSGVVTTTMPLAHDRPIDFGLQRFCEGCNKCARECPSGAITAGPKRMFNGYEIWKSDSQRCATYRLTTDGGAMCGRCMKTCPWNLEGLFAEAPFRWAAIRAPWLAPLLARLDDAVGRGGLNPVKKWWWDLELKPDGAYREPAAPPNRRGLQPELDLRPEDQTLAVYPAPLAPHPWPYPHPMDREKGIAAHRALLSAEDWRARVASGDESHVHRYAGDGESPVIALKVARIEKMGEAVTAYDFEAWDGGDLPPWTAGAHLSLVVAPEFLRDYSLAGDPADRSRYRIGVLREPEGRGGSALLHRIFAPGRRVFAARPANNFPLVEDARFTLLMGGGIGITPMIAMAHRLHALGRDFRLHYSVSRRAAAGFLDDLDAAPWSDRVTLHVSDEGGRADLSAVIPLWQEGAHLYTCGPDAYMQAVLAAAEARGWPEEARHLEYFSVPETPDYVNHPFRLRLAGTDRVYEVAADETAADVLIARGHAIDIKCSDGICGVCKCDLVAGEVEHRDFVLSKAERARAIITCQSRAAEPGGEIEIALRRGGEGARDGV